MKQFAFAFDPKWKPFLRLIGVTPKTASVDIVDGQLDIRFGLWRLKTPLSNIGPTHITENYRWWTAFGPRQSFKDRGLSFGTNAKRGLCISFNEPMGGFGSGRRPKHPAVTVTVDDVEGLQKALERTARG